MNIDLCFVPSTHEIDQKVPAVSGSSGHLVIESPPDNTTEKPWPGRIFEDQNLDYSEAMRQFVEHSQASSRVSEAAPDDSEKPTVTAQKRALRQEEARLRDERRTVRQQRTHENALWKQLKAERKQQTRTHSQFSSAERKAQAERWRVIRQQRRETQARRKIEDQVWRQKRLHFKEQWGLLPIITAWIAILVITDNCTRQCVGLPLFIAGPKVTADMIIDALTALLPPKLHFLITDRGTHFTANIFEQFAQQKEFIHVLIARHRPQSNGIAERFVRTLKEWLRDTSWQNDQELAVLLGLFLQEYNERPHQGLPIPGLSPNEYANRIWIM